MKQLMLVTLGWLCFSCLAYADHLSVSIGVSCDPKFERALVRLGYADDDDEPKFAEIDNSLDGGLSRLPVNDSSNLPTKTYATCSWPNGNIVKAVMEQSNGCPHNWCEYKFSVWVNKIRVIHNRNVSNSDRNFAFGVIVSKDSYNQCNYELSPDKIGYFDAYSLTSAESKQLHTDIPVVCDSEKTKWDPNTKQIGTDSTNTGNVSDQNDQDSIAADFVNQAFLIGKRGAESVTKYYSFRHKKPTDFKQAGFVGRLPKSVRSISMARETNIIQVALRSASHQVIEFTPIFDEKNYQIDWKCRGQGIPPKYLSEQCIEPETRIAASFDCSKASTTIEEMICGDTELSMLNGELNNLYHHVSERGADKQKIKQEQRRWLKDERNACQNIDCLKTTYKNRITFLTKSDSAK